MKILMAAFTLFSFNSFGGDLGVMKQEAKEHINEKISHLQESKSCIDEATTTEDFKACKSRMHDKMKKQSQEARDEKTKFEKQEAKEDKEALEEESEY